ncbi:uncharacterized protein BYT42DRAFT_568355 [Radiomyces spectabilis]|uniref:uncharacterized protein n=1 Tax=Radiomyces spectabilis TaxID=64574 RepID=UPI002220060E|nr:uncharacterized protein BYT42DRAFT_568355 [Radiomyces spectabilis]KAI8379296.1 hypothetical protein BYT42DRAFT_568355 [Radiomyces spectabilis]
MCDIELQTNTKNASVLSCYVILLAENDGWKCGSSSWFLFFAFVNLCHIHSISMVDVKQSPADLLKQEEETQFTSFSADDALSLGLALIEAAKPYKKPVVVDIALAGHQLFHYAMQGTGPDNNDWVRRKNNTVMRFRHSSYYVGRYCASQGKTIEQKYFVSEKEYAGHGGAFPLIIRGTGVVGTITVSGLAQEDDHNVVVQTIEKYIKQCQK